jgi:hypothetical protein
MRAEKIEYQYVFENNKLILDDFFVMDSDLKQRNQRIAITLYLPKNLYINPDNSVSNYLSRYDNSNYFNKGFDRKIYQMLDNGIKCSNCDEENQEEVELNNGEGETKTRSLIEVEQKTTTYTIDENGVKIETKNKNSNETKGLKIDNNGVIIKTN